jgi:hypothetical protein
MASLFGMQAPCATSLCLCICWRPAHTPPPSPHALQDSLSASLPKDGSVAVFKVSDTATLTDLMKAVETGDMDKTLKELGHLLGGESDVSVLLPLCWPVAFSPTCHRLDGSSPLSSCAWLSGDASFGLCAAQ